MTITEANIRFLNLVNRNATNNKVNVDKARFILLFNDMQNRLIEWKLDKRNEDEIRDIQKILVQEFSMDLGDNETSHDRYELPNDYFDFANITATAHTDCCGEAKLTLYEIKSEDVEEKLGDSNTVPDYDARESFYYFSNDSVLLYKKDFEYDEVLLTYYRYPVQVDIAGYTKEDNTPSININPEFDDKVVNRILVAMSKEFSAINSDAQDYQISKDRLFTI